MFNYRQINISQIYMSKMKCGGFDILDHYIKYNMSTLIMIDKHIFIIIVFI